MSPRAGLFAGWFAVLGVTVGVRLWNALVGPRMWGYDAWGHVAYVLFVDLYRAVPWADQGWSYFHPPLHYVLGALIASAGSGEVLMRGLALLGSAASLGIAALAARLARLTVPERPWLALAAFAAVATLPVHYFMSPMPGNELVAAFLTAATLGVLIANERRERATLAGAAAVGVLAGLGLLTKFSGLLVLLVVCASCACRALLRGAWADRPGRVAARIGVSAGVALLLAAPYYARNLAEFGTPFQLSRDFPLVTSVERDQPPGRRSVGDYLRFPPAAFSDPNPLAPHLLHSVWASVYLNVWADTHRESDVSRALEAEGTRRRSTGLLALLGLLPTFAALWGAGLALRDVRRGRRRPVYVPLLLEAAAGIASFALFAWLVPIWSALKASYLLGLSLPFALFLVRSFEELAQRPVVWQRWVLPGAAAGVAAVASWVALAGAVLPRRADAPATAAVHFYFGEYDAARRIYGRLVEGSGYAVPWLDNLAAVELADGRTAEARRFYGRAVTLERESGRRDPYRAGRWAVASALDGDAPGAEAILDAEIATEPRPELLVNRGVLRAARGDLAAAEADLRAGLGIEPRQPAGWLALAALLERAGRADEAALARQRARGEACRPPRGYPYGVGTGEVLEWGVARRPHLLLDDAGKLGLASRDFHRRRCQ